MYVKNQELLLNHYIMMKQLLLLTRNFVSPNSTIWLYNTGAAFRCGNSDRYSDTLRKLVSRNRRYSSLHDKNNTKNKKINIHKPHIKRSTKLTNTNTSIIPTLLTTNHAFTKAQYSCGYFLKKLRYRNSPISKKSR